MRVCMTLKVGASQRFTDAQAPLFIRGELQDGENTVCSVSAPAEKLASLRAKYTKVDLKPRDYLHNWYNWNP